MYKEPTIENSSSLTITKAQVDYHLYHSLNNQHTYEYGWRVPSLWHCYSYHCDLAVCCIFYLNLNCSGRHQFIWHHCYDSDGEYYWHVDNCQYNHRARWYWRQPHWVCNSCKLFYILYSHVARPIDCEDWIGTMRLDVASSVFQTSEARVDHLTIVCFRSMMVTVLLGTYELKRLEKRKVGWCDWLMFMP